ESLGVHRIQPGSHHQAPLLDHQRQHAVMLEVLVRELGGERLQRLQFGQGHTPPPGPFGAVVVSGAGGGAVVVSGGVAGRLTGAGSSTGGVIGSTGTYGEMRPPRFSISSRTRSASSSVATM